MVERIVLNHTNTELLAVNTQKNNKFNVRTLNMLIKELVYWA